MKQYPFGFFNESAMKGCHVNLGKLRHEIVLKCNNSDTLQGYDRYYFDRDTTDNVGIDQYNVESYFYREF